ncbi:MAG: GNAT family N-acetyltransferase [Sedimentisphaerales bacterium]|nr:GNAT family N-acetyltransferase [Sedimentisphaerales bacterium]
MAYSTHKEQRIDDSKQIFNDTADNLEIQKISSLDEIESIRSIWQQMQAKESHPQINADIDSYLSAVKSATEQVRPHIILVKQNGMPVSMLIGYIQTSHLKCKLGRKIVFKPSLKTFNVIYGGILGNPSENIRDSIFGVLFKSLRNGETDVIHFNHLEIHSELYQAARYKPSALCRGYFPKVEIHWSMPVPRNIEEFFRNCSKKQRQNLKRYARNLEKKFPGQVRMVTYSKENEVEQAIKTASQISFQTYQRSFNGGIIDNDRTRSLFNTAAKKGWFRMHILYIADEPCAFRYRLKYKGTYFAEAIGYLPKWKHLKIGHVLFVKVIEEICKDTDIQRLDFGFGDGDHKQWGKMNSRQEASIYIFALRFYPVLVNLVFSLTAGITLLIRYCVTKSGIFNSVQHYRREKALGKRNTAS